MDLQNVVNQTARILGGPPVAGRDDVYSGAGVSAGGKSIKFAYSRLPELASLGEDGLVAIVFWDAARLAEGADAGDLTKMEHRIKVQLLLSMARSDMPKAMGILTPFVPAMFSAFAAKVTLNGAAMGGAFVRRFNGFLDYDHGCLYPGRIALEMELEATEEEAIAYSA